MVNSLQGIDNELDLLDISLQDIVDSITLEDIQTFLKSLGVEDFEVYEDKGYIICPTICHNPLNEEASMKLYWYQKNKMFKCYTECNEVMTIFTLYEKFMKINYHEVTFSEAVDYVKKCLKHIKVSNTKVYKSNFNPDQYNFDAQVPELTEYPRHMLDYFTHMYHPSWLKDGILPEVMDKFHISFYLSQNKVVIPHLDINGRLVGIRGRAFNPEEVENGMKYRPITIGNIVYAHPTHFNLYGIYEHKEGIKARRSAIIAEAEKSVLLDDGYYGDFSNTVACCGSNINKYQVNLLTNVLGVNEITIAFDKEYDDWRSDKAREYRTHIENMCKKYKGQATFYYIWDMDNFLKEKDSPFDRGKEVFEKLYKHRIRVR